MRAPRIILATVAAAVASTSPGRSAPDQRAGQPPGAQSCLGCHGKNSTVPVLAGRSASEIEASMAQFRDGSRPATIMSRIAKGFSVDEMHAIAEWLAHGGEDR